MTTTPPKYQLKSPIGTSTCTIYIVEECILVNKFHHDAVVGLREMLEVAQEMERITGGAPFLSMIDLTNKFVHFNFNDEAREYGAKGPMTKNIIKQAIVVNTMALKIVTNFYFRFNQPLYPSRAFNKTSLAIDWLLKP